MTNVYVMTNAQAVDWGRPRQLPQQVCPGRPGIVHLDKGPAWQMAGLGSPPLPLRYPPVPLCLRCCLMLALLLCDYGVLWHMTVPSAQGLPASVDFSRQGMSVLQVIDSYLLKKAILHNTPEILLRIARCKGLCELASTTHTHARTHARVKCTTEQLPCVYSDLHHTKVSMGQTE